MNIGKKIKQTRERLGLNMTALAKRADVGQSSLSHIENNNRQPTFDVLERIINALGLTLFDFFAEEDPSPDLPPALKELLDNAQDLTSTQLKSLNAFLNSMKESK